MPGPFTQLTQPFAASNGPPNPALFQPSPPTDQSRTTADILSALARSIFTGSPAQGGADFSQYLMGNPSPVAPAPQVAQVQGAAPTSAGTLPGELRVDPNVLYPSGQGGPLLRGEYRIPPSILNPPASPGGGSTPGPTGVPPPSSPGGDQNPPPMLRPAPDGGDALASGDPAAVLTTAVNAGSAAQNDPDITQSVIKDLMAMGGDPDQNKWLALAKAGFAMAASKNPSIFGAAGEGALAGLSDYQDARQKGLEYRYQAAQLQQAAQEHAAQIAYQQNQQALAEKEFQEKVSEYQQTLPADLALKAAQADFYRQHGNYFDARASQPPGSGGAGGWRNALYTQLSAQNVPPAQIAQILSGKQTDPVSLARTILAGNVMMQQSADGPAQAMAQAQQLIRLGQQGVASEAQGTGTAAGGGQAATIAAAKQAIAAGADAGQVKQRLQQMGIDPSVLGQ